MQSLMLAAVTELVHLIPTLQSTTFAWKKEGGEVFKFIEDTLMPNKFILECARCKVCTCGALICANPAGGKSRHKCKSSKTELGNAIAAHLQQSGDGATEDVLDCASPSA